MRSSTSWVSVAELLERHVPLHWSEAVAVLAELCAVLLGRDVNVIPYAADVLINGEGKLSIRTEDAGEANGVALGRMLHHLLTSATAPPPAPLRLFVSQAISSDRYHAVAAYATGLAAYEVPGREKLIQALHDRWIAMRTEATTSLEIPLRPEPEQEKTPESKARARHVPRWAIATVAIAVVVSGSAGAWLAAGAKVPSVPAAIQRAFAWVGASEPSHVAAAEPDTRNTKRTRVAKRRSAAAPAGTSHPDLDAASAPGSTETTPVTGSIAAADTTDGPDGETWTTDVVSDRSAPTAVASALAASGETPGTLEEVATGADLTVYSRAFPGVVPPKILPRQIAAREAASPGVEATSTLELLVDESGEVEEVKLLSRPSPVLATMLLSAAKTWKFRPAMNDGRPVRYLLRLDVLTTRP